MENYTNSPRFQSIRRPGAEEGVNLSKRRAWFANEVAYGFSQSRHLFKERVTTIGVNAVNNLILASNEEHDRQLRELLDALVTTDERINTSPSVRYYLPSGGTHQPVDEMGVADPTRETGYYQVGYPIFRGESAFGVSFEAVQKATLEEINREVLAVQRKDARWMIDRILFALFYNQAWTFEDDEYDTLTVQPLANGDSVKYPIAGKKDLETDNHYQAQADAIADAHDPFPAIYDELDEHPSSSGMYVSFVPSNLVSAIEGLGNFNPRYQSRFTRRGADVTEVMESADAMVSFGDKVLGEHDAGVLVVRWRSMPSNYILTVDVGTDSVLRMREDSAETLRGLININAVENSGNTLLRRFRRKAGFGAANRVGAVVTRIGDGSYAPPTGYDTVPAG